MVRVLAFAALVFVLSGSRASIEDNAGHPLFEHRAVATDQTARISDAVRERFALDRVVATCNFSENLYAYRTLLARFTGPSKSLVEAAADAGRNTDPAPVTRDISCTQAVDRLRKADDKLLALSETVDHN